MPKPETLPFTLVSDFDGTVTKNDFFLLAIERLSPPDLPDYWGAYLRNEITHFEALASIFQHLDGQEEDLLKIARDTMPDPNLAQSMASLWNAGWQVIVASAGCGWYIEKLLAAAGVQVEIHSNPGEYVPGRGLVMSLPKDSPYFSPSHGIDKAAIVKAALQRSEKVAFAGDGFPDAPAARLVPAELRFARRDLATALDEAKLPYRPFEVWSEVAEMLLRDSAN